jgi:hypothetical protein
MIIDDDRRALSLKVRKTFLGLAGRFVIIKEDQSKKKSIVFPLGKKRDEALPKAKPQRHRKKWYTPFTLGHPDGFSRQTTRTLEHFI